MENGQWCDLLVLLGLQLVKEKFLQRLVYC